MRILIVKYGALGDVLRTSYFAEPLRDKFGHRLELSWLAGPCAVPLIRLNPHIDRLVTTFDELKGETFDVVYSLDDETEVLDGVAGLNAKRIVGAYLKEGEVLYSTDSAGWFDMGLRSRFGKLRADELKKLNRRGHAEIFAEIFEVSAAVAAFHGDAVLEPQLARWVGTDRPIIGINPFAGERWPSKEIRPNELRRFLADLFGSDGLLRDCGGAVLIGAAADRRRNLDLARELCYPRLRVADTDASVLALAALVRNLDLLVTSDSLPMHLAISQNVPTIAFFSPTSASEIDSFGCVHKIASTAADYCSYRSNADNSTITAARLMDAVRRVARSKASLGTGPTLRPRRDNELGPPRV